jgi:hypothetical protein
MMDARYELWDVLVQSLGRIVSVNALTACLGLFHRVVLPEPPNRNCGDVRDPSAGMKRGTPGWALQRGQGYNVGI